MGMKRSEFLRRMAALGVGAAASGSGLTLLDPTRAFGYALKEHAGETLTVITQDRPPIASAIADKGLSAAFKKEFGKPLAPPVTWDDFMNVARFFGDGKHGVHGVAEAYRHGGQAFWYFMSNCVAWCTVPGEKGGLFFDPSTLKPLINDPGHQQGLKNYAEAVKYGPPGMINWDSNEVRQQFKNGAAVLAIDWDDTPIIGELEKGTKVKGKISSGLLPGTHRVWNYKT